MINYDFIVRKIKSKGYKVNDVAEKIGVQYQTLIKNVKNGSFETVFKISQVLEINFIELLIAPEGYSHFYDDITGKWLGIREK